jgi:hypothetical protein
LLEKVICPTCWHEFAPEDIFWIAVHDSLTDDRIAGGGQLRFLPSRFNVQGFAYDERERVCTDLACPRCLNLMVQQSLQMPPLFLSIFGAPGSGKSFYLAAMIRGLKQLLYPKFQLRFQSASAEGNSLITEYERQLFGHSVARKKVKLEKTQETGDVWYHQARIDGQDMLLPRPYLYTVQPPPDPSYASVDEHLARTICLYDNAGEQFLPGTDQGNAPVIDHLAKSEALLFVFDPIQEARFRRKCIESGCTDPQVTEAPYTHSQADVLTKVVSRIRSLTRLPATKLYDKPLIVIVNKYDAWKEILTKEPTTPDKIIGTDDKGNTLFDVDRLLRFSTIMENLLQELTPEIVNEAKSFANEVMFIPVTTTGKSPECVANTVDPNGIPLLLFEQGTLKPRWVELPVLFALHRATSRGGRSLLEQSMKDIYRISDKRA